MVALDLRMQAPRSPYATLLDLYMLPRTIDKARAILAGTNGSYEMEGLSAVLLRELDIAASDFFSICGTSSDAEIAVWISARRLNINVEYINARLFELTSEGDEFERLARDYYPWLRGRPLHRWMDIALNDDEITFGENAGQQYVARVDDPS